MVGLTMCVRVGGDLIILLTLRVESLAFLLLRCCASVGTAAEIDLILKERRRNGSNEPAGRYMLYSTACWLAQLRSPSLSTYSYRCDS